MQPTATTPGATKKITVLDTDLVAVWYYPEDKIVHHQIKQFISGQPFRDFLNAGAAIFEQYRAEKWLSDDRGSPVIRPEDIDWGDKNWFPRVAAAGWKYWAIVRPDKAVAQMVMKDLSAKYAKSGVTSKWFTDPDDALWWLRSQ